MTRVDTHWRKTRVVRLLPIRKQIIFHTEGIFKILKSEEHFSVTLIQSLVGVLLILVILSSCPDYSGFLVSVILNSLEAWKF